jgi:hypothetical protein
VIRRTAFWFGAAALVLLLLAVLVLRGCDWFDSDEGPAETDGPVTVVPDSVIDRGRPTTRRDLGDRIVRARAKPKVQVTDTHRDTARSERYAAMADTARELRQLRDSLARAKAAGDTSAHPERVPQPRAVLPPVQGVLDGRRITLWGVKSDGNKARAMARLGLFRPRVQFVMGMDAASDSIPVIDYDRWYVALVRQGWRCLPRSVVLGGGLGAAAAPRGAGGQRDRLGGAVLGAGLILLGCIVG